MAALQTINIPLVNFQTGATLPGATLTVYKTGTVVKASIYDLTGAARANPITADATGLCQFQVRAGQLYDVVWTLGAYTSPRYIVGGDIVGLMALLAVFPETFGAAGDGVTDDKAAIEAACASLGLKGGIVTLASDTVYRVSSLTIPPNVTVRGTLERPDLIVANSAASMANLPGLALDSTGTITLSTNASLTHCFVKRYGMAFPDVLGNYAGTAITQNGDAPIVRNCLVVGFNKILAQTGTSVSRYVVEGLYADGLNGLWIDKPSYDSSIVRDTRIYPYAQQPSVNYATMVKSGYGFNFAAGQDNTVVDNCLAWGFFHNYHFQGTSAMQIGTIWSDYPTSVTTAGQVGVYLGPNVANIGAGNLQIWGGQVGLSQNSNNTETFFMSMLTVVSTSAHAIVANGGELVCPVTKLQNIGGIGVNILDSGSHVVLRGYALNVTGAVVSVPSGGSPNFIDVDLKTDPFYTPNGTALFQTNGMVPLSCPSATTMPIPANGNMFTVTGTTTIANISGGWGSREITLTFASALTINQTGNILLGTTTYTSAAGKWIRLLYDASISKWVEMCRGPLPVAGTVGRGRIAGLTVSNNVSTPNTKLDIAVGEATDSSVAVTMSGAAATLDITTTGVALGLDTGTRANNTWYHLYLIGKADGTTTYIASTSASAPAYPTGYIYGRRIFSFLTDGSANIVPFLHREETVHWAASFADIATADMATTNALYALTVPAGIRTRPIFDLGSSTASVNLLAFDGDAAGYAPGASDISTSPGYNISGGSAGSIERVTDVYTNTARQVRVRSNVSTAELYAYTRGYADSRGRFD
mgnify:FL=1